LSSIGIQPIISHPERQPYLVRAQQTTFNFQARADNLGVPLKWFDYPMHLQITAGSLLGQFGQQAKTAAWYFLKTGLASLVATDCHDLSSRRPCMKAAFQVICAQLGRQAAKRVCVDNPAKILNGQDIESPRTTSTRMSDDGVLPTNF
jgi:protein-tyrosine phosphatase